MYKVGEKVRCIEPDYSGECLNMNGIYEIIELSPDNHYISDPKYYTCRVKPIKSDDKIVDRYWWNLSRFKNLRKDKLKRVLCLK